MKRKPSHPIRQDRKHLPRTLPRNRSIPAAVPPPGHAKGMKTHRIAQPAIPPSLRARAERIKAMARRTPHLLSGAKVSVHVQALTHELGVHQVELEMQNEELRRVQLELENSRDRFAWLYDFAPVGYLTLDAEGVIREANLTATRLLGLDRQELLKKNLSRFVAAESQDDFYLHRQQVFTHASLQTCDLQMRRPDGATFSGRLETVVEAAGPGQPAQCLVALSDVTRLLRAEALRQSEANYRSLFELNPAPIWICDEKTLAFLDVNEAALRLYGYSREAFLQLTAKDIRPPEDVPKLLRAVTGQQNARATFVGEWRHVKRDGTVFEVDVTTSSIQYAGRDARLVLVNDITDRKRAEDALRHQQDLLQSVMRTTDVMLVLLDRQFNFVWVNNAYAATCRMMPEEMVGQNHFALYPSKENEAIFREVRDTGHAVFYKDKPFSFRDQPERGVTYWDWSLSPVKNERGDVTGLVFSLRETTPFKQAEDALARSRAEQSAMFEAVMDAAVFTDAERRIALVNPAFTRMFGYSADEVRGEPRDFSTPARVPIGSWDAAATSAAGPSRPGCTRSRTGARMVRCSGPNRRAARSGTPGTRRSGLSASTATSPRASRPRRRCSGKRNRIGLSRRTCRASSIGCTSTTTSGWNSSTNRWSR